MENNTEKKVDRRVRKTKKQLRTGLTILLKEKPIKDITVRELAELVDINRGTFYLHYKDIYDLISEIEDEMFTDINNILMSYSHSSTETISSLPVLRHLFTYLAENCDMCIALLGKNGDIAFIERLKKTVRNKCLNDWLSVLNKSNFENFDYCYSFIVSGLVGLISIWLRKGMQKSADEMAQMAEQMILHGMGMLEM